MRILLDTCTFLWIAAQAERLSDTALALFRDPANEVFLSSASAWEIVVKSTLGRLHLPEPPDAYVPRLRGRHQIRPLPLDEASALHLLRLPALHRDPFDRMLVCQAIVHGMTLLTPDVAITQYPANTKW